MTPEQLLQHCEKLTHAGRLHHMVELGSLAASDASVHDTIAVFAQGDVYQRLLATQSCYGSRNTAQVLRALADPSHSVRSLALHLVALICSNDELQVALNMVPLDTKEVLLRYLYKRHKQDAVDVYLEALATRQDDTLQYVLSFGSREVVVRHLGQVVGQLDLVGWKRLARHYPDLVVAHLRTQAAAAQTLDPQLVLQINAVLPLLVRRVPDQALDLVRARSMYVPLERLDLQVLVYQRPNEMAEVFLQTDEQSHRLNFNPIAHCLTSEHLLALFTRYPGAINYGCFAKLRPQQRLAVYTACERGWRTSEGVLPYHIVAALPTMQRLQEGRRHLALPALITRPQERFPYAAFLPWEEALALLNTPLRSPDADLRSAALKALIAATRYQRTHLADVLQLVRNRRNEQDPVRREILTALAALPHGIWRAEHLDDLAQIIQDALNATDLSNATAQSMERLVVHLFPFHPEWSAGQMAIVYSKRGNVSIYRLDNYLSDTDIRNLAPILMPILQAWQRRESEELLVALAVALGRRLRVFDALADLLEATLNQTLLSGVASTILNLFLEHQHTRVYLLIPKLLRQDKSAITLWSVSTYLHRYRQDLLTPFLGQHAYKGRFDTGRTRFVLPLSDGFHRWTPTQQEIFASTLLEIVHEQDQHHATSVLLATIRRLAAMPFIDPALLIQFANDERQPVREATLRVLGRLDAGQGIPTLLDALNDERARIAIYALRGALLVMPVEEALNLLRKAPLTQVTVAKEVVRLIGELSSEAAYRELLTLDARDLHRDVRVALLRALWPHGERAETWDIFTRAAQSPDTAIARGVIYIPADGLSPTAQKRLVALVATLLAHPEPEVRINALQRCSQHPLTDDGHVLFARLLALLNSSLPDECAKAAQTVFAIYTGNDAALVSEAVRDVLGNRRALQIVCNNFSSALRSNRQLLLPTTRTILAALAEDQLTLTLRIGLLFAGLPWEEIMPALMKLAERLHVGAINTAWRAIQQAATRPDAQLFDFEMALAASDNEDLRRLALVTLVAQSKQVGGWSDERVARLERYRDDPSPMVAEAAQFTFVS
ncbi:MAG: hypothetical protein ABI234_15095 [Ktedonobacteraceae bacterium]